MLRHGPHLLLHHLYYEPLSWFTNTGGNDYLVTKVLSSKQWSMNKDCHISYEAIKRYEYTVTRKAKIYNSSISTYEHAPTFGWSNLDQLRTDHPDPVCNNNQYTDAILHKPNMTMQQLKWLC